jgi:predicted  nucleic acid-binding Zn-ribbon protein
MEEPLMNRQLELLIMLTDVCFMLDDLKSGKMTDEEKELGFKLGQEEKLQEAEKDLRSQIEGRWLGHFDRIRTKYSHPVVPVRNNVCHGCFLTLPTSMPSKERINQEVMLCNNCARFLYWINV